MTFLFVLMFGRFMHTKHFLEASQSSVVEVYTLFVGDWSTELLLVGMGTIEGILERSVCCHFFTRLRPPRPKRQFITDFWIYLRLILTILRKCILAMLLLRRLVFFSCFSSEGLLREYARYRRLLNLAEFC